jgi:ferredoxin--NADP+ reductase
VVVGNGNVAMDVTRMLVRSLDELARTDMADHALAALRRSRVREIAVLGRGAAQASFTTPEVRELGRLEGVDVAVDPATSGSTRPAGPGWRRTARPRPTCAQLQEYAARPPGTAPRRITLRFLASPVEVLGDGRAEAVRVERNPLVVDPNASMTSKRPVPLDKQQARLGLHGRGHAGRPARAQGRRRRPPRPLWGR